MIRIKQTVLCCLLAMLSIGAFAKSAPVVTLEKLTSGIIAQLDSFKQGKLTRPQLLSSIKKEVIVYLDEDMMAKQVVGRFAWQQAKPDVKKAFVREFVDTVLASYAHVLADYDDQTIEFKEPRGGDQGRYVQVQSWILAQNGQKTEVVYHMRNRSGQWRIYDIGVEGVSLVSSYHSQFSHVLTSQGLGGLVDMLKKQAKGRA